MSRLVTVRQRLVRLVLACMLPTVLAAVMAITYVYTQERSGFERSLFEASRALALVVDRELAKREAMLKTLAESPDLTARDLAAFYDHARRVAPGVDTTLVLSDLDGQQLLNTRRRLGDTLPTTVFGAQRRAAGPLATLVSELYFAPLGKQHSFAVEVPVVRDGRPIYYLSMGSYARHMQQVLADQRLAKGWVATILDPGGTVVARTDNLERFIGTKPSAEVMNALEEGTISPVRMSSLDGRSIVAVFSRSPAHKWGIAIGVPESQITSPKRAATGFALAALALLSASLLAALRLGRQLVEPIQSLAASAEALGRGEPIPPQPAQLAETDRVAQALAQASTSIRESSEQMEARVRHALDEADKAHRAVIQNQRLEAIGQLTGGVAHDFNNLLMVVNTNVHLLRARHPQLATDAQLQRIDRAVATGGKLTRQLLAFARRQPLRPEVVDLGTALPELMALIRPTLSSAVTASCDVAPGIGCVEVDPAELELAIINLAVNAKDAMPSGGRLALSARNETGADGRAIVRIDVADTGTGIPPEIAEKVFEPFFTTKEVGRGTGLGLSQVYGMATQAGGTAQLRSTPGEGTTVSILLPAVDRLPDREATSPGLARAPLGCSVLLVEDNPDLAQASRELLTQAGCRVQAAGNAAEALAMLEAMSPPPQLVLSDIRMPGGMDGIALATELRRRRPGLPVLLMTGYTAELEAARAAGLQVIAKPTPAPQLLAAVAGAVAGAPTPAGGTA